MRTQRCKKMARGGQTLVLALLLAAVGLSWAGDEPPARTQIQRLIKAGRYASAARMITEIQNAEGIQADLSCQMVSLALNRRFLQKKYEVFYLADSSQKGAPPRYFTVRRPVQLLQRVLEQFPDYAPAYKLLGDYYRLQLSQINGIQFVPASVREKIQEKIFNFYQKAVKTGAQNSSILLWMGEYYQRLKQWATAEKYLNAALKKKKRNPRIYLNLAEIYLAEGHFARAYNAASSAHKFLKTKNLPVLYRNLRIAGLALQNLGEEKRFLQYAQRCIQLMPDEQAAYRDIILFYQNKNKPAVAEKYIYQMLTNNPFDAEGFRDAREFAKKFRNFDFIGKLLSDLSVQFEDSPQVMGNIYWLRGSILTDRGKPMKAGIMWQISRQYYRKMIPADSSSRSLFPEELVQSYLE